MSPDRFPPRPRGLGRTRVGTRSDPPPRNAGRTIRPKPLPRPGGTGQSIRLRHWDSSARQVIQKRSRWPDFGKRERGGGRSSILRSQAPRQEAANSKLQAPKKLQAPSSKTNLRAVGLGICSSGLVFEIWNFSGGWGLVLGVSPSGGPPEHLLASAV